jgi:hypothetical protein
VKKVSFFVGDEGKRWRLIGTDAKGGNAAYGVSWKVDYAAGARLRFSAEAFDEAGNKTVDTVGGVIVASLAPAPQAGSGTRFGDAAMSLSSLGAAWLGPGLAIVLVSAVVVRRRVRTGRSL